MVYDELGRLMRSVGAANQTTKYSYDRTDLITAVTDPRNGVTGYAYDGLARLIRETNPESAEVNLTRNRQDDVVAYADPRNITTSYVRNGFGEVIQEVSPDAGTTTYVRDARGLVTQMTDGRGVVTTMTYDAAGRMLTKTYSASVAENITYTYDNIASSNKGKGRLTKITDQSGTTEFVYDALGRLTSNKHSIAGKFYMTLYASNAAGRLIGMTYPDGRTLVITRDAPGRATSVTTEQTTASVAETIATAIVYRPMSDMVGSLTHGNGLVTNATHDLDERLTQLQLLDSATLVQGFAYAYADGMNLTGITDQLVPANSNTLGYLPANRLASASGAWGSAVYCSDPVGNRVNDIVTGTTNTSR
jgi:YD repeat-containing protein